jgi:hypothetical protein
MIQTVLAQRMPVVAVGVSVVFAVEIAIFYP